MVLWLPVAVLCKELCRKAYTALLMKQPSEGSSRFGDPPETLRQVVHQHRVKVYAPGAPGAPPMSQLGFDSGLGTRGPREIDALSKPRDGFSLKKHSSFRPEEGQVKVESLLGPPARCQLLYRYLFWVGRVPLLKLTTEESWYPYSNLSTGGPSSHCSLPEFVDCRRCFSPAQRPKHFRFADWPQSNILRRALRNATGTTVFWLEGVQSVWA